MSQFAATETANTVHRSRRSELTRLVAEQRARVAAELVERGAPYTASEVCDLIDGLSYRMLDYWIRAGTITPSVAACGSGTRRHFDELDVAAVRAVVEQLNDAHEQIARARSGDTFTTERARLARARRRGA